MVWSGGKDSALALYEMRQHPEYRVEGLLTTVNEHHRRVSMHGVRMSLLTEQAQALGLPLYPVWVPESPTKATYEARMEAALLSFKAKGIETAVFGDIFLADLRQYREQQLARLGMRAVFPLWGRESAKVVEQFIELGFKATVVCVSGRLLDQSFAGRALDTSFLHALPAGADPCGENGEYHTFVSDGPIFNEPVRFQLGECVYRDYASSPSSAAPSPADSLLQATPVHDTGFWFCDLVESEC